MMDATDLNKIAGQQIYELKPLEMVSAKDLGVGQGYSILRVPGGWLFLFLDSTCFVPMDFEFQLEKVRTIKSDAETAKKKTKLKSASKHLTADGTKRKKSRNG
jgi:hypothetical protein